jgi:NAD(P)-dependent dehydrogenase (short-subunit alcohol dehydrogenase family)
MGLEDRVAVITGATGGLGRVVARILAERGARLALFSTNAEHLEALVRELDLTESRYLTRALDFTVRGAAHAAVEAVLEKFQRADILLHLVGGWAGGKPVVELDTVDVAKMLDQHLWTTIYLAQAFVPHFIANRWGRIIVISSPTASRPAAERAPYAVGKAAQEALMLTLAQELKDTGVTANAIVVSTIDVKHERERGRAANTDSWTESEEIAAAILYLASEDARVVNGARIPLYGGP